LDAAAFLRVSAAAAAIETLLKGGYPQE